MPLEQLPSSSSSKTDMELMRAIHSVNPYEGFDTTGFRYDAQGWNSERQVFKDLIDQVCPQLIIEIGSWKGASAIFMGEYLRQKKSSCLILCVDTWLGGLDSWQDPKNSIRYTALKLKQGYPALYYQFLFNVIDRRLTDRIIPFPQTSIIASRWLKQNRVEADLIYIDGSHDEEDVYLDLVHYLELVKKGGVLFGDDYGDAATGVKAAVDRFAGERSLAVEMKEDQFWVISKE
ncbi:MAG: class I SAM-dependent methyltransferase [Candidatus Omnitrophica bacterium]|nr:class I SAM-dependent methyltransferase [Candidatus Omnitrophota bacterium]MDD5670370.1 class I SAM-dependent methyltransferase [Candidatus Omnitrophota bacterium]